MVVVEAIEAKKWTLQILRNFEQLDQLLLFIAPVTRAGPGRALDKEYLVIIRNNFC